MKIKKNIFYWGGGQGRGGGSGWGEGGSGWL